MLTTFEAAQTIFAWLHEAPWKIGYSVVSFSEMMNAIRLTADIEALSFEAQLGPATAWGHGARILQRSLDAFVSGPLSEFPQLRGCLSHIVLLC